MIYTIEIHWSKEEFPLVYNSYPQGIETIRQWKCKKENQLSKLIDELNELLYDYPIINSQIVAQQLPATRDPFLQLYKVTDYRVEAAYCSSLYKQGMEILPTNNTPGAKISYYPKQGAKPIWSHDNPTNIIKLTGLSIVIRITS